MCSLREACEYVLVVQVGFLLLKWQIFLILILFYLHLILVIYVPLVFTFLMCDGTIFVPWSENSHQLMIMKFLSPGEIWRIKE